MRTLIQQAVLFDKQDPLHQKEIDLVIEDGQISSITPAQSEKFVVDRVIDGRGAFLSSGWVDIHTHLFTRVTDLGIDADVCGVHSGVTCCVDAGSAGADTIDQFQAQMVSKNTKVKALINLSTRGLQDRHELKDVRWINNTWTRQAIEKWSSFVVGIKLRASQSVMGDQASYAFQQAAVLRDATGLNLTVHVGNAPPPLETTLSYLKAGDIMTHTFNPKANGILRNHQIADFVLDAKKRGVLFDVGHGEASFGLDVFEESLKFSFLPDFISSDLHKYSIKTGAVSLANVLTKVFNLGMSLEDVIDMVTTRPRNHFRLQDIGGIEKGNLASLTLFKIEEKTVTLRDSTGAMRQGKEAIVPVACMIGDQYFPVTQVLFE